MPKLLLTYLAHRQVIVWKKVEGKWLAHNVMVNYDFKSEDLSQMDDDSEATDHTCDSIV